MIAFSGNVWGNLFKNTRQEVLPGVINLCSTLMGREISNYRSGIYEITVVEPESAKYLPLASIVKGVIEFIRKGVKIILHLHFFTINSIIII